MFLAGFFEKLNLKNFDLEAITGFFRDFFQSENSFAIVAGIFILLVFLFFAFRPFKNDKDRESRRPSFLVLLLIVAAFLVGFYLGKGSKGKTESESGSDLRIPISSWVERDGTDGSRL